MVAQMEERLLAKEKVEGSNPSHLGVVAQWKSASPSRWRSWVRILPTLQIENIGCSARRRPRVRISFTLHSNRMER